MSRTDAHVPDFVALQRADQTLVCTRHSWLCELSVGRKARPQFRKTCGLEGGEAHCQQYLPRHLDRQPWSRRGSAVSPSRAKVRDELRSAVADYNAHGETDIEPEPCYDMACLCQACGLDF